MSCARTRSKLVELELGLLPAGQASRLAAHLEHCAACASAAHEEVRLSESLTGLRGEIPFEIDVTARVASRIGDIPPNYGSDVPARQLAWAAAAAAGFAVAVFASFILVSGDAAIVARDVWTAAVGLTETLGRALMGLLSMAAVPFRILVLLLDQLSRLGPFFARAEPFVVALSAVAIAVMAGTVVLVVSHDIRTRPLDTGRLSLL